MFEPLCHETELTNVHFLKPVERTASVNIMKQGRHASCMHEDVVLFKAELGSEVAPGEAGPVQEGVTFPEPPPSGKGWPDVTERRDRAIHYARCNKLQLKYIQLPSRLKSTKHIVHV